MKKLFSLYVKACIVFLSVFITPAAVACIITLDLNIYMSWVTAPIYIVLMFFIAIIFTANATEYLVEIS